MLIPDVDTKNDLESTLAYTSVDVYKGKSCTLNVRPPDKSPHGVSSRVKTKMAGKCSGEFCGELRGMCRGVSRSE